MGFGTELSETGWSCFTGFSENICFGFDPGRFTPPKSQVPMNPETQNPRATQSKTWSQLWIPPCSHEVCSDLKCKQRSSDEHRLESSMWILHTSPKTGMFASGGLGQSIAEEEGLIFKGSSHCGNYGWPLISNPNGSWDLLKITTKVQSKLGPGLLERWNLHEPELASELARGSKT